jgi:hypothetical protein
VYRLALVFVFASCSKKPADKPIDAGPTVLEPMENPDPPKPSATAPDPGPAGWALEYTDDMDLPADAGADRCADGGAARDVIVRLDLTHGAKSVSLVIASIGYRKQLWDPMHQNPSSCSAGRHPKENALVFHCAEDLTSIGGKVYLRGSDVVLGTNGFSDGKKQERIPLPCGSKVRFEAPPHTGPAPSR